MNDRAFDGWTRQAKAGVSRRASLLSIGGAALLVGVTSPRLAEAKKTRKRKKCKRPVETTCETQVTATCGTQQDQCRATTEAVCQGDAECLDILLRCCDPLATCDGAGVAACYLPFIFRV